VIGMRGAGAALVAAAALFWISWILMPGVGVTDARRIFELVSAQRPLAAASVVVQLVSAVLYVPPLLGVVARPDLGTRRDVQWGAGLWLVGATGSAADAVLHLLAYAMTAPGLDPAPLVPVMEFMQGPGLLLLAPLLAAFFVGGAWLSVSLGRAGVVSRWNPALHGLALVVALAGAAAARADLVAPRLVGLAFLLVICAAQAWLGVALRALRMSAPRSAS
jgi:hypothetical protein